MRTSTLSGGTSVRYCTGRVVFRRAPRIGFAFPQSRFAREHQNIGGWSRRTTVLFFAGFGVLVLGAVFGIWLRSHGI
jgi:hypothetical protein